MSESNKLTKIHQLIKKAAKKYRTEPYNVSAAQFWAVADSQISEWEIRKLGGFSAIRGIEFPAPEIANDKAIRPQMGTKFKLRTAPLENFTVHQTSVDELFRQAKLKKTEVFRLVVQPDTHVPEHDPRAVSAFCDFLKWYKPHGLVNLGDFMEMGSVAHWEPKNASPRRLVPEIKMGRDVLKRIDKAAGPNCIYKRFIIGNHEDWLDQLLVAKVPEIYDGIEELGIGLRIQDMLGLKDLGYRVIPLNEILQVGELCFIHGLYTGTSHAKKHLEVFGTNIVYGHVHDVQVFSSVNVRGLHEATSCGCLRKLNAEFLKNKPNNWAHAFGVIEFRHDGKFTKTVPVMVDGQFSYAGKIFGASEE